MEVAILIAVCLLALLAIVWIGAGALVILPVTVGICIVGWLIAGSTGAIVGLVLSGILGAIVLARGRQLAMRSKAVARLIEAGLKRRPKA